MAQGLLKRFGERVAVDGIDVTIQRGERFGFLGPNGAGKTTTMRMMGALSPRNGGELSVLGLDPEIEPRALKRRLGVVAQETTLDLELTVRENLEVFARYFDVPLEEARPRAADLLAFVGLSERAEDAVERLSGGMKRRLQVARALVNRPDLVLLDEPTTGLDPQARHVVWERLRELSSAGTTLVLTTHYMEEAAQLCDRLVVMDEGRIVGAGTPGELVEQVTGRDVLELRVDPDQAPAVAATLGRRARGHQADGGLVLLFTDDADGLWADAQHDGLPVRLQAARRATLEDVFLVLTGRSLRDDGV